MPDSNDPIPAAAPAREYGVGRKLIGKDYETPDLYAKVTGQAKYAEDYHADGMLFCKLLLSPMPHARVKHIDAREALAMPGVRAILTADDLPPPADSLTDNGTVIKANPKSERALTMEPVYQGEPILAIAAVDELTAADAIEKIHLDLEPLPFVLDPLETLRPGGPNPRIGRKHLDHASNAATRSRHQVLRRLSGSSSGPRRISRTPGMVSCRWARRPTNGLTATSTRASRVQRSSLTKLSSRRTPVIRRSKRAAPWPTGRMERSTFTPARRAPRKQYQPSQDG